MNVSKKALIAVAVVVAVALGSIVVFDGANFTSPLAVFQHN